MQVITLTELKQKGALYIDKIEQGFADHESKLITGSEAEIKEYLLTKIKQNGWENSWIDFYYGRLDAAERERVREALTIEQRQFLETRQWQEDELYFGLTAELFEIAFVLSVREVLFSSFYFTQEPCTVWGNYERKFVEFI